MGSNMNCFSAKAKVGNTAHRLHSLIRKPYNLHFAHGFEFKSKMMMMILNNSFVVKKMPPTHFVVNSHTHKVQKY